MRARVAGALAALSIILVVLAQPLYPAADFDPSATILFISSATSFTAVGAFLAVRVPQNAIGTLLMAAGVLLSIGVFSGAYALASVDRAGASWPLTALAGWLTNLLFIPPVVIVAAAVPSIFPDGRLPSPRWRWLPIAMVMGVMLSSAKPAFMVGPIGELPVDNPFGIPALEPLLSITDLVATLTAAPVLLGAVAAVAVRYRRGTTVERQQIKWLLAVASVAAVSFSIAFTATIVAPLTRLADVGWVIGFAALAALPLAIAAAILRYRLYEIDRLVSRTVGWTAVTGILVAVFACAVVALQGLLSGFTQGQTLAVAASTLLAFALFQPLRGRVQRAVDRRFDRARYDGERVSTAFAERLRDQVDLAGIERDLAITVGIAMSPESSAVWLRERAGAR
jgi:hypothetical protein